MRPIRYCILFSVFLIHHLSGSLKAQEIVIRRLPGGVLQVRNENNTDLFLIQSEPEPPKPMGLNKEPVFYLGTDFSATLVQPKAQGQSQVTPVAADSKIPSGNVLVEPVLVGQKRAGIRVRTNNVTWVIANVDMLSDQSFITTQRDQNIDLLTLSFADPTRLDTARINLWVSLINTRQIALNPTDKMTEAQMVKFYKSLPTKRVLPTGILPMIKIPNINLQFGDRQVVLLRELELLQ